MLVKTLLEAKPPSLFTAKPTTPFDEAMELLIKNQIGCLPIVGDDGKLVGVVSDKDIFKKIHETKGDYHSLKLADVMTTEVVVGLPTDDLTYIAGLMDKNWIRHVPIVEGERVIGVVSQRDVIKTQTESMHIENRYLNLYMEQMHRRDKSGDA
jgi:CBS domain-containing protein